MFLKKDWRDNKYKLIPTLIIFFNYYLIFFFLDKNYKLNASDTSTKKELWSDYGQITGTKYSFSKIQVVNQSEKKFLFIYS